MSRWSLVARLRPAFARISTPSGVLLVATLLLLGGLPRAASGQNGKGQKKPPVGDTVKTQFCMPDDPSCFPVPNVAPHGANVTVSPGTNSYAFTVQNVSHSGILYFSNTTCSGAASGCTVSPSSASLATNATATVTVTYTGASAGGSGTVDLFAQDGTGTYTDDGWINVTVNPPPSYTVAVTPDGASTNTEPGSGLAYSFTVQNTGNQTTTYNLTPSCSGVVTNCSSTQGSVTLGAGASAAVSVSYNALTRGASGTLALMAAYSGNSGINDAGSVTVNVNNSYGVAVTPDGGSQSYQAGTGLVYVTFTVHNTGTSTVTYTMSTTCRVGFNVVSGSCSASPTSASVVAGATSTVTATADASMLGANFQVELDANDAAHGSSDAGTVNVAMTTYTVSLSPHGGSHSSDAGIRDSIGFTIQDVGNTAATYALAAACSGTGVQSCAGPGSIALNPQVPTTVYVTYTPGSAGATGTVSLVASGGSGASATKDSAYVSVTVYSHTVAVTPDGATQTVRTGTGLSYSFTVQNTGIQSSTYNLTASCSGVVTNCSAPAPITLNPGSATPVSVTYNAVSGGQGTLSLTATYSGNSAIHDNGSVTITADPPHPQTVTVSLSNAAPPVGTTVTATATVTDQYGASMPSQSVTWSSSATNVATVTSTGTQTANVTGVAPGSATITATAGAVSGSAVVSPGQVGSLTATLLGPSRAGAIDRGACLTIAVSDAAAYECGDLRIVQALPTTTTMNKPRTPTLIYSSNHAVPGALIAVDVNDAGNTPTSLQYAVTISRAATNDLPLPPVTLSWNSACANQTCRIVIPINAAQYSLAQGAYDFTLTVNAITSTTTLASTQVSGVLTIVDRSTSTFGAGWWLDGLEKLVPVVRHPDRLLWVGGDGSTRVYTQTSNGSTIWTVQPTLDRPDTLEEIGSGLSTVWRRHLRNGAYVEFDNLYRHTRTVNTRGWKTQFCYASATDVAVKKITLPIPGGTDTTCAAGPTYTFAYYNDQNNNNAHILRSVTAPPIAQGATRVSMITPRDTTSASDYFIANIQDDSTIVTSKVTFGQTTGTLITTRTNRVGAQTTFSYDATAGKLIRVDRNNSYNAPNFSPTQITSYFCPAEIRPNASCTRASGTSSALALDLSTKDSTIMDGPRTDVIDVTKFLIDGWGAPATIADAKGAVTTLKRTDSRFPSLVTEMDYPNGRTVIAGYTDRGLIQYSTDNSAADITGVPGDVARTDYTWHATYDLLLGITTPMKVSTKFDYYLDPTDRARFLSRRIQYDSVQGSAAAVTFDYYAATDSFPGLAKSTTLPARSSSQGGTATETYDYDTLGNIRSVTSPLGLQHHFGRDGIGRVVSDSTQIDRLSQANPPGWLIVFTNYDDLDRVKHVRTDGPAHAGYDSLYTETYSDYDNEGRLLDLTRQGAILAAGLQPNETKWTYDLLGRRVTVETQDVDANSNTIWRADTTMYDEAGNPLYQRTRRNLKTSFVFDELNHMTSRSADAYSAPKQLIGMADPTRQVDSQSAENLPYPYYPTNTTTGSYDIPQDNASFTFDPVTGLMTDANNGYAQIHRDYYANGLLKAEILKLAQWSGAGGSSPSFTHTYITSYAYDKDGRRTSLTYPAAIAPSTSQTVVRYNYDTSGELQSVVDLLNRQFTFAYNWRGERTELKMPGGILDSLMRDDEGLITRQSVRTSAGYGTGTADVRDESFTDYDAMGRLIRSHDLQGIQADHYALYDGIGQLRYDVFTSLTYPGSSITTQSINRYTPDALGNMTHTDGNDIQVAGTSAAGDNGSTTDQTYDHISGRLVSTTYSSAPQPMITQYDSSGNATWNTYAAFQLYAEQKDRRSYYDAQNVLRAVDTRRYVSVDNYDRTFEEYAYDALGRRVMVRSRRACTGKPIANGGVDGECAVSFIRRTIWDGAQELGEIQMPGADGAADLESDGTFGFQQVNIASNTTDANHFYGETAYTFGPKLDEPLAVTRMNYADGMSSGAFYRFQSAFDIVPFWNQRQQMDNGRFNDGSTQYSETPTGGTPRYVNVDIPAGWFAYARSQFATVTVWHGSLLSDKADKSGLMYRRNRYYDPASGRFTQEDPVGLAGGLNLYGFAAADPVNFSDPFGLFPGWGEIKDWTSNEWNGIKKKFKDSFWDTVIRIWIAAHGGRTRQIEPTPPPPVIAPAPPPDPKKDGTPKGDPSTPPPPPSTTDPMDNFGTFPGLVPNWFPVFPKLDPLKVPLPGLPGMPTLPLGPIL